jgi:glycerophosphoryl diester phosphodiesterase
VRFFETSRPRVFAHRGASGLFPENTLDAFAAGLREGASILELDVRSSRDGHVVVMHDETLERTTDGSGPVAAHTLAELRRLDAGYRFRDAVGEHRYRGTGMRIPTFAEVLEAFPATPLNVEIKQLDPPITATVFELLDAYRASERVLLAAGDDAVMESIRAAVRAGRSCLTGFSEREAGEFVMRCAGGDFQGYRPPGVALQVPRWYQGVEIVTAALLEKSRALGVEVHVWTVNEETEITTLLDLGVDGIMSDFPSRVAAVLSCRRPTSR